MSTAAAVSKLFLHNLLHLSFKEHLLGIHFENEIREHENKVVMGCNK